jgi:two-component system, chemotaxis family, chemotaxis protein CheY
MVGARRQRILLVDDDDGIRRVVTGFLTGEGYDVAGAADGKAALEQLEQFKPDIILLDMRMPILDGWEFVRLYRSMPGPHAPIVAFVATAQPHTLQQEIGAAALIEKPFDLDDLLQALDQAKDVQEGPYVSPVPGELRLVATDPQAAV